LTINIILVFLLLLYLTFATQQNTSARLKTGEDGNVNAAVLANVDVQETEEDYEELVQAEKEAAKDNNNINEV
jgi:membrane protein involved in colicin uptake